MNYRCPKCSQRLKVRSLLFHDITACANCGEKVVLGDFLAFFMAAVTMSVAAIVTLYVLSQELEEYLVAAGYALSAGMLGGLVVLVVLGKAVPFRRVRILRGKPSGTTRPAPAEPSARKA